MLKARGAAETARAGSGDSLEIIHLFSKWIGRGTFKQGSRQNANPSIAAKRGKGAMGDRGFASSEAQVNRADPSEARMGARRGHRPRPTGSRGAADRGDATTRGRVGYGGRGTSPRRNAAVPNCGVLRLWRGGSGGDGKRPSLKRGGCDRRQASPKMRRKVGPLVSFRLARQ